jgi:hypothetical protein
MINEKNSKIQTVLVYILFIYAVLARIFQGVSVIIEGGGIWNSDIIAMMIITVYIIVRNRYSRIKFNTNNQKIILSIVLIFFVPLFIGIVRGNDLITIFRDARVIPFYIIPLIIMESLDSPKKITKFIKFTITFSIINLLLFYIMFLFKVQLPSQLGIDTAYDMGYAYIERYGITTATFFYPFSLFILFNMFLDNEYFYKKAFHIVIMFGLIFAIFFYAMRSFVIGVILAFILNLIMRRRKKNTIYVFYSVIILSAILVLSVPAKKILEIPQIRRLATVIDPTLSSRGVQNNLEVRIQAIDLAVNYTDNLIFGSGFGDKQVENSNQRYNLARWWNHSSYAWAIYKLGLFFFIIFMMLYTMFLRNTYKIAKKIGVNNQFSPILFGLLFYLISVLGLAGGTNIFYRGDFLTIFITITLGTILSIEKIVKEEFVNRDENFEK